jgi:hypothetical protein
MQLLARLVGVLRVQDLQASTRIAGTDVTQGIHARPSTLSFASQCSYYGGRPAKRSTLTATGNSDPFPVLSDPLLTTANPPLPRGLPNLSVSRGAGKSPPRLETTSIMPLRYSRLGNSSLNIHVLLRRHSSVWPAALVFSKGSDVRLQKVRFRRRFTLMCIHVSTFCTA